MELRNEASFPLSNGFYDHCKNLFNLLFKVRSLKKGVAGPQKVSFEPNSVAAYL